jgi:hypothetical protein
MASIAHLLSLPFTQAGGCLDDVGGLRTFVAAKLMIAKLTQH